MFNFQCVIHSVEETPTESHFEPQLEDDTAEVPEGI